MCGDVGFAMSFTSTSDCGAFNSDGDGEGGSGMEHAVISGSKGVAGKDLVGDGPADEIFVELNMRGGG